MNTLIQTLKYFVTITIELVVLFILISAIIEYILLHISEDKMQKKLSGKGIIGNIIGATFGALTPFCACSTIPMTVGFLNAKVSFGSAMSFLIASPDNRFAVPEAAIVGIPLYIRAETAIPIGVALMGKGMSIGAVIALVIGGAGMAIPEISMLAGIFKPKLVVAIVVTVFLTAIISGFLFNILL